ncbi:MAG TPA: arsenosugar biosynthesis radical SAM (seleno)protein ArsS [Burkholderiaceae bacterium]|jgi:radical SAM/Cys-rich protein|nr:arsenosugar biosynthesis radical SAM (seleno)protein ArsS [Burkholderiaceae bacterium]
MHATLPLLRATDFPRIRRRAIDSLQVNLGYTCNQTCVHCHVNAGPNRTEQMDRATVDLVLEVVRARSIRSLDLTGGAPELNVHFRFLVSAARALGAEVIDRCNLTILEEPGQETLAEFLAGEGVRVVASLPCYSQENVDKQRGAGVFDKSIRGLQKLNSLGYGQHDSGLMLELVYNPQGPALPPPQVKLEGDYKRLLGENFGIRFNRLLTITNQPISRFGSTLVSKGTFRDYMALLRAAHREDNLDGVMCRSLVSVDWRGYLYDCDFNQMLAIPLREQGRRAERVHLADLLVTDLADNPIAIADHCYACTAGQGSSCGGALAE